MKLRACLFGLVLAAAACGDDGGGAPKTDANTSTDSSTAIDSSTGPDAPMADAPDYDFSCVNDPAPTTAPDTVTISGNVSNVTFAGTEPVAAAMVSGHRANGQALGQPDISDAQGAFQLSLPSGGSPIDGYVQASKAGHRTTRVYPPSPVSGNLTMVPVVLLSNSSFDLVQQLAGTQQDNDKGVVGLVVVDCSNQPIGGATISVKQGNAEVGDRWDASAVGQPGAWVVFNVPAGLTTVSATYDNKTFRAHDVQSVVNVTSTTGVRPGF